MNRARGWRQRQVEDRWGMPFFDVIADLAAQDLTQRDAGRAIGYESWDQYIALRQVLERHPDRNPWAHKHSIPTQYTLDTGEAFRDAVLRLAKTHTATEVARIIGYTSVKNLRYAMQARGFDAVFCAAQRGGKQPTVSRTITDAEAADYIDRVSRGQSTRYAAFAVGRDRASLRHAAERFETNP